MGGARVPIYDYQCEACQHRFELRQGFDAESVAVCPSCQGKAKRKISRVGVIFKGSGWYVTDYARKNSTLSDGGPKESGEPLKTGGSAESNGAPGSTMDTAKSSESSSKPAESSSKAEGS